MKKEQAQRWYLKGFEDAETTERQPVTHDQTMRDAETHFHLVWDATEVIAFGRDRVPDLVELRESAEPAPEQMEFSKAFIEALREVVRISDRKHSAWGEVKAFLAALDVHDDYLDDGYLDRLVKKASPAWKGVDPQQFLDEVGGRPADAIEWKPGPPEEDGDYLIATNRIGGGYILDYRQCWGIGDILEKRVIAHIGPIPKTPDHV